MFFASLPIQFDTPSNWMELEQMQTDIGIFIEYHRMEHWIKTHDYFQHQMSLHREYLSNVEEYTEWLKQERTRLIRKEEERLRKEEEERKRKEAEERKRKEEEERKRKKEEEELKQDADKETKEPELSLNESDTELPANVPFGRGSIVSMEKHVVNLDGDNKQDQNQEHGPSDLDEVEEKAVHDQKEDISDMATITTSAANQVVEQKDEDAKEEKEPPVLPSDSQSNPSAVVQSDAPPPPSSGVNITIEKAESLFDAPQVDSTEDDIGLFEQAHDELAIDSELDFVQMDAVDPNNMNSVQSMQLSMDSHPAMLINADDQSAISGFGSTEPLDLLTDLTADQQVKLTQLVSMGFSAILSRRCLEVTGFNIRNAIQLAADMSNDFDVVDPTQSQDQSKEIGSNTTNAVKPQLMPDYNGPIPLDMTGVVMIDDISDMPVDSMSAQTMSAPMVQSMWSVSPKPPPDDSGSKNGDKSTNPQKSKNDEKPAADSTVDSNSKSEDISGDIAPVPPSIKLEVSTTSNGPPPPPKPKALQPLKLGGNSVLKMSVLQRRKRDEMAAEAKKQLINLMSTLPEVEDGSIPDASSNETAVTPFNLSYFKQRSGGSAFISKPKNLSKLFEDICKSTFPLQSLLRLQTLINLGLSIYYSRHIVQSMFSRWMDQTLWNRTEDTGDITSIIRSTQRQASLQILELEHLSSAEEEEKDDRKEKEDILMALLDGEEISDFYRFLKLYVFRNDAKPEQSQRRLLQLLIQKSGSKLRTQLVDGAIVELRTAAQETAKYNGFQWGFRSLVDSDMNILNEPRVELSLAILNEAVGSSAGTKRANTADGISAGISLEQFVRMNVCLRTANMPLKCHLFGIITKLLLSLPFDDVDVLSEWIEKLPVRGLEQLARERYKKETGSSESASPPSSSPFGGGGYFSQLSASSAFSRAAQKAQASGQRLLKSQYLTQFLELVVVAKAIEERVEKLKYRMKLQTDLMSGVDLKKKGIDGVHIFVVDVTSTTICIGWNTKKEADKIWPDCYILQMKKSSNSEWKTLMKGNGRQWLVDKGLKPRKKYYFRMQAILIGDDNGGSNQSNESNIIRGDWTREVTVTTLPDLTWNPHKKGRATVEFFNGNTRAILQSGGDRWRTITANKGFNSGKQSWTIKVFKTNRTFIFIGVVTGSANIDTFCGGDQYGYGFFLQDRYRYHNRGKVSAERVAGGHEFKKDDEITLTLDFNNQALSVAVNGKQHGELFCGVFDTAELWYPAVSLYHKSDGVEFVDKSAKKSSISRLDVTVAETKKMEAFEQTFINFKDTFFLSRALCARQVGGGAKIPKNIMSVAYCEWKSWYSHTVRVVKTMHKTLFIDIDEEKCKRVLGGYGPNAMVESWKSFGTFKVLGLVRKDDGLFAGTAESEKFKEFYFLKEGARDIQKGSIKTFLEEVAPEVTESEQKEETKDDGDDDDADTLKPKVSLDPEVSEETGSVVEVPGNESAQSPISQARSPSGDGDGNYAVEMEAVSRKQEEKEEKDEDQKEEKSQPDDAIEGDGGDGDGDGDPDDAEQQVDETQESKDDGDKEEKDADQNQIDDDEPNDAAQPQNENEENGVNADSANVLNTANVDGGGREQKEEATTVENAESTKKEDAANSPKKKKEADKDGLNNPAGIESEKKQSEISSEKEESRVFSVEEEREMNDFFDSVSNDSIWTPKRDAALLRAAGQVASSVDLPIWSLLSTDLKNFNIFKMASELAHDPRITFKSLTQRFILLKLFNRSLSFVLPFISFDFKYATKAMLGQQSNSDIERGAIFNYGAQICRYLFLLKPLIFSDLKNNLLSDLISFTNTPTAPNEDPYEDPPSLKKVTINRHKARKAIEMYSAAANASNASNDGTGTVDGGDRVLQNSIFYQLYAALKYLENKDLRRNYAAKLDDGQERTFKVKFFGEGVQDNGGPYRETFHELIDEVFNEQQLLPLFIKSPNFEHSDGRIQDKFVPNPSCSAYPLFQFFGRIIGICVRNHILINFNLSSIVWKQLIGPLLNTITLEDDIAEIDEGFVRQYDFVKNVEAGSPTDGAGDAVDLSYINFVFKRCDGSEVELIPNGKNVTLTLQNRDNYLALMLHHKIHEFDDQIAAIRRGLSDILPLHLLPIYTHLELEHVVCGDSDFSVDLLKSMTVYEGDLSPSSFHVKMFWSMLRTLSPAEKEMFLRFTWAKTRMPSKKSQFKGNTFKLQPYSLSSSGSSDGNGGKQNVDLLLPRSHTCFFSLQLPPYSALEIMKERFLYAFNNTASMDRDLKLQDSELYNYQNDDV